MFNMDMERGRVYSGDPDYDALRGRVVSHSRVKGITLDGWVVWHERKVMDFAKQPVKAANPDAQLEDDEAESITFDAHERLMGAGDVLARRRAALDAVLVAHMQAHGPTPVGELSELVTWSTDTVRAHLRSKPDVYVCYQEMPAVFGLPGQKWTGTATKKPNLRQLIRDLLAEQGTLTSTQIGQRLGLRSGVAAGTMTRYKDWFCVVGTAKAANGLPVFVWGLVGIHDATT